MRRYRFGGTVIASAGYDAQSALLEIEFEQNGQVWEYSDVPEDVWYELRCADRPDEFFQRTLKGRYLEKRIPNE